MHQTYIESDGSINWENNTFNNPFSCCYPNLQTNSKQLISNLSLNYNFMEGTWCWKLNYGHTDNRLTKAGLFYNPSTNIGSERSAIRKGEVMNNSWIVETTAYCDKQFGTTNFKFYFCSTFSGAAQYKSGFVCLQFSIRWTYWKYRFRSESGCQQYRVICIPPSITMTVELPIWREIYHESNRPAGWFQPFRSEQ